jgi:hypothetical protein
MGLKMSDTQLINAANRFGGQFDKAEEAQYTCVRMTRKKATTVSIFDVNLDRNN